MEKKKSSVPGIIGLIIVIALVIGGIYLFRVYSLANRFSKALQNKSFTFDVEADTTKEPNEWLQKVMDYLNDGKKVELSHYRMQGGYNGGIIESNVIIAGLPLTDVVLTENVSMMNIGDIYNEVKKVVLSASNSLLLQLLVPDWKGTPYIAFETLGGMVGNKNFVSSTLPQKIDSYIDYADSKVVFAAFMVANEKNLGKKQVSFHVTGADKNIAKLLGEEVQIPEDMELDIEIDMSGEDILIQIRSNELPEGKYKNVDCKVCLTDYTLKNEKPEYLTEKDSTILQIITGIMDLISGK